MAVAKQCLAHVQGPAPHFRAEAVLPDGQFQTVSLDDFKGKYLVLFSYPLDFTFVCPTEIIAFSESVDRFRAINCEVLAFSCDSKFCHLAWMNTPRKEGGLGPMKIPLMADASRKIAIEYGAMQEDLENPMRGLWIISDKGIIRHITMNDPPVGRNVEEVLRLVQAFQFVDEHGEVCPVNWHPGAETMKADPKGAKEYFKKH